MAGASLSVTVTVNEQFAVWPLEAVTRCVTVVVPTGKVTPLPKPAIRVVVAPGQLSVPTGAVYVTVAPQVPGDVFTEIFAGHEITGTSLSVTVTVNEQSVVCPLEAVTRCVTVVIPTGKVLPLAGPAMRAVLAPGQLSVPTGAVYVTVAPQVPAAVFTEILLGQVIAGAILSMSTWITFE